MGGGGRRYAVIMVPVTWDGLDLNLASEDARGVLRVVEDVTGWYDSPPFDGRDATFVLTDGAQRGPKTAGPRDVVITGVGLGSRSALALFRDDLIVRAASVTSADLVIIDGANRAMTARVRADSDAFKHTFSGPTMFRYQLTVTATDPRLYGPPQQVTLTNLGSGDTGWKYDQDSSFAAAFMTITAGTGQPQVGTETPIAAPPGTPVSFHVRLRPRGDVINYNIQLRTPGNNTYVNVATGAVTAGTLVDTTATWTVPAASTGIEGRIVCSTNTVTDVYLGDLQVNGVTANANPAFLTGTSPWVQYGSAVMSWTAQVGQPSPVPVRAYPRRYANPVVPNSAVLLNEGNVPAPVHAAYAGDLSQSRLMAQSTGREINLAALGAGTEVNVDTATLAATAPGGPSRASYVLAGSQSLMVAPQASDVWSLYATGGGSVILTWRSAWQ